MTDNKLECLKSYIRELGNVAIAFSSGVDSTFLLKVAHDELGEKCIAITGSSESFPQREKDEARIFCQKEGIKQIVFEPHEIELEEYARNPENRCYICKKVLFGKMKDLAMQNGSKYLLEGSNMDDLGDYRPGLKAIEELEIISPLRECGLTKAEIREYSRDMDLPTWDKPSFACLASRFVYGERITADKLRMVDKAEELLFSMGFKQFRVRIHGTNMARIEVIPEDIKVVASDSVREKIYREFKQIGFNYITLDLMGYRTGSMNETINTDKK